MGSARRTAYIVKDTRPIFLKPSEIAKWFENEEELIEYRKRWGVL